MPVDKKFLSSHDVDVRLNGCLIKFKKRYYVAGRCEKEAHVSLFTVDGSDSSRLDVDPNSSSVQYLFNDSIGWMPLEKDGTGLKPASSFYVVRSPVRRYKAGLSTSCLSYYITGLSKDPMLFSEQESLGQDTVQSKRFISMLENEYPDFNEIDSFLEKQLPPLNAADSFFKGKFRDNGLTIALSRDWAFRVTPYKERPSVAQLLYGVTKVGEICFTERSVSFDSGFDNSFYWELLNKDFAQRLFIFAGKIV